MPATALRRTLPAPLRAALKRLVGWAYWSRRRLARVRGAGRGPRPTGANELDISTLPSVDRALLPPGAPADCILASNEHGVYCVPRALALRRPPRPVLAALIRARVWEPDTLDLLRSADPDGDIVHAGTFVGDFLPALARSRRSGARVWGFEPNTATYLCARVTTLLNGLRNVELTHAGLAGASGTALLAISDRDGLALGGGSRLVADLSRARWTETEQIVLIAIDEVISADRHVAAIHLSVQRHEREALTGAMRTIERCRPLIVLASRPSAKWIAANLSPLGYRAQGSVDANTILRCG